MHHLPETGFLRLKQIIGNAKSVPPVPAIIPVSKSTWWEGVRKGKYPQPVRSLGLLILFDLTLTGFSQSRLWC